MRLGSEESVGEEVQSVARCLRVLKSFTPERPEFGVSELARLHGVHVSSMSRLLATMAAQGFLRPGLAEGSYRLGLAVIELGTFARVTLDVRAVAAPTLWELASRTGETVSLAIRSGSEAVVIERAPGSTDAFGYTIWVGRRLPLHASGHGKALIAFLAPEEQEAQLATMGKRGTLEKYTPRTISTVAELKKDLEEARMRGYVVSRAELDRYGGGVAAPVFDHEGMLRASIAIPEFDHLLDARRERVLADHVLGAAARISEQIGGPMRSRR